MLQLTNEERLIKIPNLKNCRDLGGYETQSGYYTKAHKYLRSSNVATLTSKDLDALLDYGVDVVVDLRGSFEQSKQPNQLIDFEQISYYHVDMLDLGRLEDVDDSTKNYDELTGYYRFVVEAAKGQIKKVFEIFLKHQDDTILFHCSQGKDRTGIIAALLMDLVGCFEYDIVKNYSETATHIAQMMPYLEALVEDGNKQYLSSHPNNMIFLLGYLYENYGSARGYLMDIGLSEDQIDQLVESFVI